ncbi:RidA family protein [Methylobacterium sp. J-001]|uniref:RidA family protein n=1 Tax=Methylobacterium sp. J-001 TaxID=2836609 RepID=UPI001FB91F91|nr:RidA family protein [Methylobacterium sp. J-001]MCJ2115189.1 RidA family protein [Methylobacterium sp. J-001]
MIQRHIRTPIMHRVVEHGGVLYLGGIVAEDRSASMKGQTEQVLARVDALLSETGSDKSKILTATLYITDMNLKDEMNEAWTAWLAPEILPSRSTIGVAELGPKVLIEAVITAAK